ncbi:hypothetical protein ACOMHN_033013 [Nucella lapillus]
MDTYVIPTSGLTGSTSSQVACDFKVLSSSSDTNSQASDPDLSSKNIMPEKHRKEKVQREQVNTGKRKECEDESVKKSSCRKDGASSKNSASFASKQNSESRKRTSESASVDDCPADSKESVPCKKCLLSPGPSEDGHCLHMADGSGLTVKQLVEYVQTRKRTGLRAEYARIRSKPPSGTFSHCRARHNLPKNRYTDVLCYDHSRVTLSSTADLPSADYIHANLVDGYMQKNAYISTQGPLPRTSVDFWRMVWQYQCRVIVMTTRTVERQRLKCGQYWPNEEQSEEQFQELTVSNKSVKSFDNYVETMLLLHNSKTGESREVCHLQFVSWPDFGVPPAAGFLEFLLHVRQVQERASRRMGKAWSGHPRGPPIIVHCSAGIGRTGTFIAIDISLRSLEDTGTVDIPITVRRIRTQRAMSIQTPDQYAFCYMAVIQHAVRAGLLTDVQLPDMDSSESDSE